MNALEKGKVDGRKNAPAKGVNVWGGSSSLVELQGGPIGQGENELSKKRGVQEKKIGVCARKGQSKTGKRSETNHERRGCSCELRGKLKGELKLLHE